jgi:hypothetical protein
LELFVFFLVLFLNVCQIESQITFPIGHFTIGSTAVTTTTTSSDVVEAVEANASSGSATNSLMGIRGQFQVMKIL